MKYFELGATKQLNQIVFAGSHDAAITEGGKNVKTQSLDIAGQAEAGVRLFDLRIGAAAGTGAVGGTKTAELRAFHGALKHEVKTRHIGGHVQQIDRNKLKYGEWGLGLEGMLADARRFVSGKFKDEFLILKFDKCSNWNLIAEACVRLLGDTIYKGAGNLNKKTLQDLRGKVVCLFTMDGITEVRPNYPVGSGILGIKSLYSKDGPPAVYVPNFDGMQYFGKGGTSVTNPFGKIGQNKKKQAKLMSEGADGNPDVMGMMYWTTTGLAESIRERNDTMWTGSNVTALRRLWSNGLAESIESRMTKHVDPTSHASGGVLKAFMPNIIMIDFADPSKCRTIYDLNSVAATALTSAARALDQEVEALQAKYADLQRNMRRRA
jgi:hypothetical protein